MGGFTTKNMIIDTQQSTTVTLTVEQLGTILDMAESQHLVLSRFNQDTSVLHNRIREVERTAAHALHALDIPTEWPGNY